MDPLSKRALLSSEEAQKKAVAAAAAVPQMQWRLGFRGLGFRDLYRVYGV